MVNCEVCFIENWVCFYVDIISLVINVLCILYDGCIADKNIVGWGGVSYTLPKKPNEGQITAYFFGVWQYFYIRKPNIFILGQIQIFYFGNVLHDENKAISYGARKQRHHEYSYVFEMIYYIKEWWRHLEKNWKLH